MPIYDYRCTDCGREVEVSHGIHAAGPATCESCGGTMRKALSAPAIHFKGSGWAKKDARSAAKPTPPTSKADAGASASARGAEAGEASTTDPAAGTTGSGASGSSSGASGSSSGPAAPPAGSGGRTE
jgi:putative FmdB family regulatory protein